MGDVQSVASQVLSAVMAVLGFLLVIVLAYISTKYAGKKFSVKNTGNGNIRIIDRLPLGADKSLLIVNSAGKTLLIGVTSQHIELICELDESMICESADSSGTTQDFYSVLKKNLEKLKKGSSKENTDEKR